MKDEVEGCSWNQKKTTSKAESEPFQWRLPSKTSLWLRRFSSKRGSLALLSQKEKDYSSDTVWSTSCQEAIKMCSVSSIKSLRPKQSSPGFPLFRRDLRLQLFHCWKKTVTPSLDVSCTTCISGKKTCHIRTRRQLLLQLQYSFRQNLQHERNKRCLRSFLLLSCLF